MVSSKPELDEIIHLALREDLGGEMHDCDVTTQFVVDPDLMAEASIIARAPGVISGGSVAARTFELMRPQAAYYALLPDGSRVANGDDVARVTGPLRSILSGERIALNFLQRLSGIATQTRRFADALVDFPRVTLLDTRKTTPGLRAMERAAVRAGGGTNHRRGLWDAILIKDNHVAAAGGVRQAIARARLAGLPVEVEVETIAQLEDALAEGAELILLDNMPPAEVGRAVEINAGRAKLEASGGMTVDKAVAMARAGVDRISVGALTHSAPALDMSLEVMKTWRQ